MFIVKSYDYCCVEETFEDECTMFDPSEHNIYEAKEIKVQRKFEIVKEVKNA